ncbi:Coiled-coil domain-containing protein 92 [Oopsacas minuta]|uniref:Coiled-coil domain-containing protein 92 n=1 Tax=Oopsacas minuta TaxID=111878 RepID=A0AAV7K0W4_9METZ|nr:Coiled-coil domain-containing protein 92 [Oopsacas minuta]
MDRINFITQEHSRTLDGLHREIHKLQGRCNYLTFKLHFSNEDQDNIADENGSDNTNAFDNIDNLRAQLEDVTQSLGAELHHKSEIINELENQLLEAQKEISILSEKQRHSQSELESKSKAIAFLTSSLQQIKSKLATSPLIQKISKPLQPISSTVFFAEEEFQTPTYKSLPPSFDPMSSPKFLVPTPPAENPKNRASHPRYHRRYSAPRLRTKSVNESLPLALLPEDKIHLVPVPSKTNKKLVLPPIPNTSRESNSRSGPMVGTLQSSKATRSTRVKDF